MEPLLITCIVIAGFSAAIVNERHGRRKAILEAEESAYLRGKRETSLFFARRKPVTGQGLRAITGFTGLRLRSFRNIRFSRNESAHSLPPRAAQPEK